MPWGLRCPAKLQHAADMILTLGRTQYNGPLTMRILKHRARPTGGGYPEFVIPRRCINCTGLGYVLNASGKGSRPCSQCEGTGVVQ